jgi:hypothetical protein
LYLTCPCSSCWRIHIMYTFMVIHCYATVNLYLTCPYPTRRGRAGKIQIDCIITMDDQEGIQNMYPPTRRARAGKIQMSCWRIHILYTFLVIHCYITVNLYLSCPCSSCWRIHIMYTFLVIHCYATVNLYLTCPCSSCWRIHILYTFLTVI